MPRNLRAAHRLRVAHEYLVWVSMRASRLPTLAEAIARATEDLAHVEAVLRSSTHKRADRAVADTILRFMEQRLLDLVSNVVEAQWRRAGPAPCGAPGRGVVVVDNSPLGEGFHERIATINSDVVRLRAIATHPSARDTLSRAVAALLDAKRWLESDPDAEVLANVESAFELAAGRVRAVHRAVERFGPAAIVETVERPRRRR
jgi:hypothetical protein